MAVSVVGQSTATHGIETVQTGIKLTTFSCRYYPQVNNPLLNESGEVVDRAISTVPSRDINMSGAVTGSSGAMAYTFITACTVANDTAVFASAIGSIFMQEATETQTNTDWRSISMSLHSDPGLTI